VSPDHKHRRHLPARSRPLFRDQGFDIERVGCESVMPGIGLTSQRARPTRRARLLAVTACPPAVRRNFWVLARKFDGL
jgi:hypothetical protein